MHDATGILELSGTVHLALMAQGVRHALRARLLDHGLSENDRHWLLEGIQFAQQALQASMATDAGQRAAMAAEGSSQVLHILRISVPDVDRTSQDGLTELKAILEAAVIEPPTPQDPEQLKAAACVFKELNSAALDRFQAMESSTPEFKPLVSSRE